MGFGRKIGFWREARWSEVGGGEAPHSGGRREAEEEEGFNFSGLLTGRTLLGFGSGIGVGALEPNPRNAVQCFILFFLPFFFFFLSSQHFL